MHRKFDDLFKIMEVDLSVVKGSVGEVAKELDIDRSDKLVRFKQEETKDWWRSISIDEQQSVEKGISDAES